MSTQNVQKVETILKGCTLAEAHETVMLIKRMALNHEFKAALKRRQRR